MPASWTVLLLSDHNFVALTCTKQHLLFYSTVTVPRMSIPTLPNEIDDCSPNKQQQYLRKRTVVGWQRRLRCAKKRRNGFAEYERPISIPTRWDLRREYPYPQGDVDNNDVHEDKNGDMKFTTMLTTLHGHEKFAAGDNAATTIKLTDR